MSSKTTRDPNKAASQIDKFRDAARELETDDSEESFDRTLKRIVVTPAKPEDGKDKKRDK